MKNITTSREQVVEFVKNHIGDTLMITTLGQGSAGYDTYRLADENAVDSLLAELEEMEYTGTVEPAKDFDGDYMLAPIEDFDACVEFEGPNGFKMQILVWDI